MKSRDVLAVLLLLGLAHLAPAAAATGQQAPAHSYVVPSCHGLAEVPGYSRCHP